MTQMSAWTTWLGIALCIAQAGVFSGLKLAAFSPSRLRLEAAAKTGDEHANTPLVTILWGNVATTVRSEWPGDVDELRRDRAEQQQAIAQRQRSLQ